MTPEDIAGNIVRKYAGENATLWTETDQWLFKEIASSIRDAVKLEREECAKEICIGCHNKLPIDSSWPDEKSVWHRGKDDTMMECKSVAIRRRGEAK